MRIDEKIAAHQAEIERLIAEKKKLEAMDPARRFAVLLHEQQCGLDHNDMCGWWWEITDGEEDWSRSTHQRWLDKAKIIMGRLPEYTIDELLEIAKVMQ